MGIKRETRAEFWERMVREGREEGARARMEEFVQEGKDGRTAYLMTFSEYQPQDGTVVRAREPGLAGESVREEQGAGRPKVTFNFRKIMEWVWEHMADTEPPRAPNGKARALLEYARKNPKEYLDKYVPLLVKGSRDFQEEAQREVVEEEEGSKALREFLEDWRREQGENEGAEA